ncbi:DUF7446 family protein [Gluconobacter roseus]|uniref:Uncharacterized protein n=1 Tax=Gluconobacter roseus NBRC 3990 TaxID=1307950 RepID=A0A4Y3MC28_9PROT|nr:hypothetical protein [Gluconobacter roseus]KXV43093.1 hypothetical protein AD943_08900 [Gluconobacter roseus]GBR43259.1 hypothetical protein AA3990_0365 [Gluconobacter roseus NBRC 3990]GEB03899.1 hypothetical protein GRO01_14750 [Gluconobacter roseus NBRC 3990]GLP94352.1 hypothetical protein GCM10007871_23300 [Gluconobacter roseus NBRC 3990]
MSAIDNIKIRFSPLSNRVVLARFGKSETDALETRDATNEFLQAFVAYAFDGKMPEKGAAVEVKFGGGDQQFVVRIERAGDPA